MLQNKIKPKTKFIAFKSSAKGRSSEDSVVWSNNCDSQELSTESEFLIGSVTQMLTAVLALVLHKKQAVDLDAPLHKYVKSKVDNFKEITLRDLLTHTAGLKNTPEGAEVRKYPNAKSAAKQFLEEQLVVQSRGTFNQSHVGYILLGAALEKATGETYYDLLEKYVTKPLRMPRTHVGKPENNKLYRQGKQKIEREEYKELHFASSSAGLCSSINDLYSFAEHMREVLDRDAISEFKKLHFCKHNGTQIMIQHSGAICGSEVTLIASFDAGLVLGGFECKMATAVN